MQQDQVSMARLQMDLQVVDSKYVQLINALRWTDIGRLNSAPFLCVVFRFWADPLLCFTLSMSPSAELMLREHLSVLLVFPRHFSIARLRNPSVESLSSLNATQLQMKQHSCRRIRSAPGATVMLGNHLQRDRVGWWCRLSFAWCCLEDVWEV